MYTHQESVLVAAVARPGRLLHRGDTPVVPTLDQKATFTVPIVPTSTQTDVPWWQQELGPAYQQRLTQLLADNPAIRLAVAEVERQRARHDAATAETGPVPAANAGSQISRNDGTRSTRHSMGIDARLPLNLSGELSATTDARAWEYRKALAELAQARLEQVRELLLALLDHAEALQRDILLQQQIETTRKQLHLTEIRFTQGLASSVDVLQQREQIASLEQRLPAIRNDARLAANRATELLGLTPAPEPAFPRELPNIPATLPAVTPMGLLQRRPDLIARQAALAAADAGFEAALRARLPSVSVSGSTFRQLLSGNPSAIVEAALDASMDLFDSGAKRAAIDEKRPLLRKAGIRYLQTWLAAVRACVRPTICSTPSTARTGNCKRPGNDWRSPTGCTGPRCPATGVASPITCRYSPPCVTCSNNSAKPCTCRPNANTPWPV